jgi:hypothetical protein
VREIAALPEDEELADTMRGDLREEYYREERARRALVEELDQLRAQEPPPPEDHDLLEELPRIPVTLEGVPEELVRDLFAAFNLVIQFDKLRDEVQLSVTLTDSLAKTIRQTDPDDGAREGAVVLPCPVPFAPTPFQNPPLVWDIGGAFGASLRVWGRRPGSREDGLKRSRRAHSYPPRFSLSPSPLAWRGRVGVGGPSREGGPYSGRRLGTPGRRG